MPIIETEGGPVLRFYHRTWGKRINKIMEEGFRRGYREMYGEGLYGTFDIESQSKLYMAQQYGDTLLACETSADRVFDWDRSTDELLSELNSADVEQSIISEIEQYLQRAPRESWIYFGISSDLARKFKDDLRPYFRGMIYTGGNDGRAIVMWDVSGVTPIGADIDDNKDVVDISYQKYRPEAIRMLEIGDNFNFGEYDFASGGLFSKEYDELLEEALPKATKTAWKFIKKKNKWDFHNLDRMFKGIFWENDGGEAFLSKMFDEAKEEFLSGLFFNKGEGTDEIDDVYDGWFKNNIKDLLNDDALNMAIEGTDWRWAHLTSDNILFCDNLFEGKLLKDPRSFENAKKVVLETIKENSVMSGQIVEDIDSLFDGRMTKDAEVVKAIEERDRLG